MSFDFLTTKGILRKLGGDKTSGSVFTFDGNPKVDSIYDGYTKISNKAPDVDTLVSISGFMGGQPLELSAADCQVRKDNVMSQITFSGRAIAFVIHTAEVEDYVGLHVICDTASNSYVSRIEFAETIHPIDTKYLPGVCLPVVELTVDHLAEIAMTDTGELSCTEGQLFDKFEKAFNTALPCVLRVTEDNGLTAAVFSPLESHSAGWAYRFEFATFVLTAVRTIYSDSTVELAPKWVFSVAEVQ